ncbi:MAG: TonB-dependent receptor plug domain-containing protein, partial [Burkholderiales bacterium]
MHGSRSKVIQRCLARTPIAAAILLACPAAMAQEKTALEEVMVTAQKRTENLQDVPISIQALGNQALEELHLKNFKDYVQMLPTVASAPTAGAGVGAPGFQQVYMRGVTSGGDGQATTSQPSVGLYLDEQPITTVQGSLDIHLYDIARVEALAGPQGTLYGASSQAGTIRIITNKPDPSGFAAGYSLEGNLVDGDDSGYVAEGFVNLPVGDQAAIRLVGWYQSDAGWIDNVHSTRTFPGVEFIEDPASLDPDNPDNLCDTTVDCTADDIDIDNAAFVKDNYNTNKVYGGRAALRIELNDNWTMTPTVMAQRQESKGSWGDDLSNYVGGNQAVSHFQKEFADDEWYQVGATIEGRIGNFDLVYSGNYLDRQVDASFDYSDYSYFYDSANTTGFFADLHFADTGPRVFPNQFVPDYFDAADVGTRIMNGDYFTNDDGYTKQSHELRISSPQDKRVRGMLGFFWQEQKHEFHQEFISPGLGTVMELNEGTDPRFNDIVYLNRMDRTDTDKAAFASVSFDLSD